MKLQLLIESKILIINDFHLLQTLKFCIYPCWHFNIYEHDRFMSMNKFYNLRARMSRLYVTFVMAEL